MHRAVYGIAIGGVVHYLWLVKADVRPPLMYGGLLAMLLGYRAWARYGYSLRLGNMPLGKIAVSKRPHQHSAPEEQAPCRVASRHPIDRSAQ